MVLMKVPYPKSPEEIQIQVLRREVEDGLLAVGKNATQMALSNKMDDYLMRLGHSNTSVWAIILQLLMKGKVQVDFRDYTERLTLVSKDDKLGSPEAVSLLEDYFAAAKGRDKLSNTEDITRK